MNPDLYPRQTMKKMYDDRYKILNENLEHDGYRNRKLRCRKKLSPTKSIFENRLADVILAFSALANISYAMVQDLAKAWFRVLFHHPCLVLPLEF